LAQMACTSVAPPGGQTVAKLIWMESNHQLNGM
jgi:hypothetical protein